MQWQVDVPIKVALSNNNNFYLNLNQYRNAHYHVLNKAKVLFADQVTPLLQGIPFLHKCGIKYTYYAPSKRETDVSNVCSIVDKFFSDTFVAAGKLKDDNYKYLDEVTYAFGGIDPQNPRVTITITQKDTFPMKVIITQADLQQALVTHIAQFGLNVEPSQISIDLDEIEIELNPVGTEDSPTKSNTEVKKRTRRSSAEVAAEKAAFEVKADSAVSKAEAIINEVIEDIEEDDDEAEDTSTVSSVLDEISEPAQETPKTASGSIFD